MATANEKRQQHQVLAKALTFKVTIVIPFEAKLPKATFIARGLSTRPCQHPALA